MKYPYYGLAEGFKPSYVIHNFMHNTAGFVGYLPSDDSIYVVFRGTTDLLNWVININYLKT
jgi:hypothetical protein